MIAPDADALKRRWAILINSPQSDKETLFHPHLRNGQPGDKHSKKIIKKALPGFELREVAVADDSQPCIEPIRYSFRSFDRQWLIPDIRLINQPNPELWEKYSSRQVYLTIGDRSPTIGPALTFTALLPDLNHYNGRGGRIFPLWSDAEGTLPNIPAALLTFLAEKFRRPITGPELLAYIAAVASNPAFTVRFKGDLVQPGLRIPLTCDEDLFLEAVSIGKTLIWLHTFGERFVNSDEGRPSRPPRLEPSIAPRIPAAGAIPQQAGAMPDSLEFDEVKQRLLVGTGYIEHVTMEMWRYELSGKNVLRQWFSYRKANRERPIIGDRRPPSRLGDIQSDHWLAEYTSELLNVLNVLGALVRLESSQADLLERICAANTITHDDLQAAGAIFKVRPNRSETRKRKSKLQQTLLP